MFKVAKGHTVTLSRQVFKSGALLPNGRDYSTLIDLGVVVQTIPVKPEFPINEPSIVKITRDKVKKTKREQAGEKKKRAKAEKESKAVKIKKPKKPKKYTVETGG